MRRISVPVGTVVAFLVLVATLAAQQPTTQRAPGQAQPMQAAEQMFTYVAEWEVAPENRAKYSDNLRNTTRPVLERLASDGTLAAWGIFATYVHQKDQNTHGFWWTAPSLANIERARTELIRAAQQQPQIPVLSHRDYLLLSTDRNARTTKPTSGFLFVISTVLQPGKEEQWRQWLATHIRPVYDDLVANGTVSSYQVDAEYVRTENPGLRFFAYVAPSAEALDKIRTAFGTAMEKRTAEQRQAFQQGIDTLFVPGSRRDYMAEAFAYWVK